MAKRGPKPKKTENYVDPVEFKSQLREYYTTGKYETELSIIITKIANGLSHSGNFVNYSYKDDMIGDAIVKMWAALKNHKFNVDSEHNPFSYFTTIAFHAFINRIKKEKKHTECLDEYRSRFYAETLNAGQEGNMIYVKPDHDENDDNGE